MTNKAIAFFLLIFCSISLWGQYDIPAKPTSDKSLIFDYSNGAFLSPTEKQQLNQKLIAYELKTSTQIIIVMVESLKGEDVSRLAVDWAHKWGVGQEKEDNGLIILMSKEDKRIAIQNGYGLEEYLTDAKSRRIIDNYITPEFKQGNFYAGLDKGINVIFDVLDGKFIEDGSHNTESNNPLTVILPFLIFGLIIYLLSRNNRGGGGRNGGRRDKDIIFTDFGRSVWFPRSGGFGSRGGGFGGGGIGGGGFGGFGGGGFGGGGASGGW